MMTNAPVYALMALMGVLIFAAVAAAYWTYRVSIARERYYQTMRMRERLTALKQLRENGLWDSAKILAKRIDREIDNES